MGNRGLARTAVLEISKEQVPEVPNEVPGEVSNRSSDPPRHATPPRSLARIGRLLLPPPC